MFIELAKIKINLCQLSIQTCRSFMHTALVPAADRQPCIDQSINFLTDYSYPIFEYLIHAEWLALD